MLSRLNSKGSEKLIHARLASEFFPLISPKAKRPPSKGYTTQNFPCRSIWRTPKPKQSNKTSLALSKDIFDGRGQNSTPSLPTVRLATKRQRKSSLYKIDSRPVSSMNSAK